MFPEMFGYKNMLFRPKGKAHKVFGKRKRKFCGVQDVITDVTRSLEMVET